MDNQIIAQNRLYNIAANLFSQLSLFFAFDLGEILFISSEKHLEGLI